MFASKVKALMKEQNKTVRAIVAESGLSSATIHKARSDEGIAECRLSTLGRIAEALGVKTKRLYDEVSRLSDKEGA